MKEDPQKIAKIKPFINKCKWEKNNFSFLKKWLEKVWEKII